MTSQEEDFIYLALESIEENSTALCEFVNKHGGELERKAYKYGVYIPAIRLQAILGTKRLKRCKVQRDEDKKKMEDYFKRLSTQRRANPPPQRHYPKAAKYYAVGFSDLLYDGLLWHMQIGG